MARRDSGESKKMKKTRKMVSQLDENSRAYGSLQQGVHIAGYALGRSLSELEALLQGDKWKFGSRFKTVNEFLTSVHLDEKEQLRLATEARKRIAARIKELQPTASVRKIAKVLGGSKSQIQRDVPRGTANSSKTGKGSDSKSGSVPKGTSSGIKAANLVLRRETAKEDRLGKVAADEQRVLALKPVPGKFRTIVLDPAWEYAWLSLAGRAKPGYAMQTIAQLEALDVAAWADDLCHLYCWTTNNFMAEATRMVKHWGFQHRVLLTWIKPPPFGLGSYFRNSTEHVLFVTRGETTTRHAAASIPTHFEAPRGEHSEKPEKFYEIVRAASYPPYGEANQRGDRKDFTSLFCPVTDAPEEFKPVTEAAE